MTRAIKTFGLAVDDAGSDRAALMRTAQIKSDAARAIAPQRHATDRDRAGLFRHDSNGDGAFVADDDADGAALFNDDAADARLGADHAAKAREAPLKRIDDGRHAVFHAEVEAESCRRACEIEVEELQRLRRRQPLHAVQRGFTKRSQDQIDHRRRHARFFRPCRKVDVVEAGIAAFAVVAREFEQLFRMTEFHEFQRR